MYQKQDKEYSSATKLFKFDIGTREELAEIEVEYFDYDGEKHFTITSEQCNVSAGSSAGWRATTFKGKELEAIKWIKGFLKDDGYKNIEVVRRVEEIDK